MAQQIVIPLRRGLGEPRPILTTHLISNYKSVMTIKDPVYVYSCYEDIDKKGEVSRVRRIHSVSKEAEEAAWKQIRESNALFVAFHIVLEQKGDCKEDPDHKKHSAVVLYNRVTGRMVLYDLLRYHLRGFKLKLLNAQVKRILIPKAMELDTGFDKLKKKPKDTREIRMVGVDNKTTAPRVIKWMKRHLKRTPEPSEWYPLLALWEMHTIIKNPTILKPKFTKMMEELDETALDTLLQKLAKEFGALVRKVYAYEDAACLDGGEIFNAESGECMEVAQREKSSVSSNVIVHKAPHLQVKQEAFVRMGGFEGKIASLLYFKHRYPGTGLYLPRTIRADENGALPVGNEVNLQWRANNKTKQYKLKVNRKIKDSFQRALKNPKVERFVFFLRLIRTSEETGKEEGFHLNTLIYDKSTNEVEHFEPYGSRLNEKYYPSMCYESLRKFFKGMGCKYISPMEFLPSLRFPQDEEGNELGVEDEYGACAIWATWYTELRLSNWGRYSREDLLVKAMRHIHRYGSFRMFVRNFEKLYMYMYSYVIKNYLHGDLPLRKIVWNPMHYVPREELSTLRNVTK